MKVVPRTAGPASANLQGRKPREGIRWWCGVRYGDLSAASAVADCGRRDCGSCAGAKRCMNRRWLASNAVGTCPIRADGRISERALPWPVESQQARRTDLQDCDAVMRCRL